MSDTTSKFRVVEIFKSIDGEGDTAGLPATFIRLHGCNLDCSYCDSKYAMEPDNYTLMSSKEICDVVQSFHIDRVTLTGGEPLIHNNIIELIGDLQAQGITVNVETNGSIDLIEALKRVYTSTHITLDYKCGSSGMSSKMNLQNLLYLDYEDVLKCVVGSIDDLKEVERLILDCPTLAKIYISPVFNCIEPKDIVEFMLNSPILIKSNARLQLQLHKIIWDPNTQGV